MFYIKKAIVAFDDTIKDADLTELGVIGDYYQTYLNREAIITLECWEVVEKYLANNNKSKRIPVLRGLFEDNLPTMGISDSIEATAKYVNYKSQLQPIILITKRSDGDYRKHLSNSVKMMSFASATTYIEQDEDFRTWKSIELLKLQKMDHDAKNKTITALKKDPTK